MRVVAGLTVVVGLLGAVSTSVAQEQPLPPVTLPPEEMQPPLPPEPPPPVPPPPSADVVMPDPPAAYGAPRESTGVNLIRPSSGPPPGLEPPAPGTPPGYPVCVEPRDDPEGAVRRPADGAERCRRGYFELIELYAWAATFGIATGAVGAFLLGADDGGAAPALFGLLGLAGGVLATYALDRMDDGFVPGVPASISTGLIVGFFEGLTLQAAFLDWDDGPGYALGGALLGGGLTAALALSTEPTVGDALLVRSGMMWGLFFGFLLGFAASDFAEDEALPWIFGGLNVGVGATMLLAREVDPSPLRVLWLNLGGLVGVFAGAIMVAAAGDPELGPGHMAVWAIGTIGGLGITWMLTSDDDQAP